MTLYQKFTARCLPYRPPLPSISGGQFAIKLTSAALKLAGSGFNAIEWQRAQFKQVLWWPRLGPAIESQWSRLHGGDLPKQIEVLRDIQSDVDRCLAHCTSLPLTDTAWLSAAVLHFTMRRKKMAHEEILQLLGRKHVQMLDSLLFFSVLDLIPVLLEEGERTKKAQENCLSTIRCLEANGGSWVTAFQPTKEKHVTLLQQTAPDALRDLLPLAFFSLAPCLPVERTVLQQDFVCVTLELYGRFLQLFVDGNPVRGQVE
ncbi:Fanconi anemia group A protein homolog [Dendrobates tinctorius]|uniref:Fanconi anemia group A protein homolog n=1 Tax=Dendrobates tinctorius TaxID=92724 RepID=UPI003CC96FDC